MQNNSGTTLDDGEVAIIGGGIGGLTLALALHDRGVDARVYEAAPALKPLGVGINLLPHAMRLLTELGVADPLEELGVPPSSAAFFNRHGQLIHEEPLGREAGYEWPQVSIHRGDLQLALADAVRERLGDDRFLLDRHCTLVEQTDDSVTIHFQGDATPIRASLAVGCDGVHSTVRESLFPGESEIRYSGVHMWRGATVTPAFLGGRTMVRAGWLTSGKLVAYPIRDDVDGNGSQLVNWVAEVERERMQDRDWNRSGDLRDFIGHFEDWHFDWLDVPEMLRGASQVLEYPMVDQRPLDAWTVGRVSLLGDAAHPMVPRGSNGAGQAILDAACLAELVAEHGATPTTLAMYEQQRLPSAAAVVDMNNTDPPDAILRVVYERTGDQPFDDIDDVIDHDELIAITDRYKDVAGYSKSDLG